jgi:ElaB/YqjD/DUF883 family membrane-anchored ribosome-binding protein
LPWTSNTIEAMPKRRGATRHLGKDGTNVTMNDRDPEATLPGLAADDTVDTGPDVTTGATRTGVFDDAAADEVAGAATPPSATGATGATGGVYPPPSSVYPPSSSVGSTAPRTPPRPTRPTGSAASGGASAANGGATSGVDQAQDRLEEAASTVSDKASDVARQGMSTGMTQAGDQLDAVAKALRNSGDQLRDEQPRMANLADTAADQVEELADRLRNTQPDELIRDAESFARRQPMLVVGGAFLLGAAAARFLKASPDRGSRSAAVGYRADGYSAPGTNDVRP